jgi:hypothetical protein
MDVIVYVECDVPPGLTLREWQIACRAERRPVGRLGRIRHRMRGLLPR